MSKNDGGPAYPSFVPMPLYPEHKIPVGGMSLRDAFAMAALTGLMNYERHIVAPSSGWQGRAAWAAYSVADAMLAAREADHG